MKRIAISFIVALGLTIPIAPIANAETLTFNCGGTAKYSVQVPQGILVGGKQCSGDVVIDKSVKIIGEGAFSETPLNSIVLSNFVTEISDSAFFRSALTSIVIPNSVKTIGSNSFSGSSLKSITFGNSITSLGQYAFAGTQLVSISIPNSVKSIGYGAFERAPLTSVTLGVGITIIESGTFKDSLLTSIRIPDSVKEIESEAFMNAPLTSVTLGKGLTSIADSAFQSTQLVSLTIPNSVKSIGAYILTGTPVTEVLITNSAVKIDPFAFGGTLLKTVTCVNGKLSKIVVSTNPNCPKGYSLVKKVEKPSSASLNKPKCSGTNLVKYNKAAKQESDQWNSYLDAVKLDERYWALTGKHLDGKLESLAYGNWLRYGYALEKYAKLCKVKMRPEWYEMLDSLPVD